MKPNYNSVDLAEVELSAELNEVSSKKIKIEMSWSSINPLRANFFRGNINIYLHFVSFLHIDTTQVVEILPQIRQEPTSST